MIIAYAMICLDAFSDKTASTLESAAGTIADHAHFLHDCRDAHFCTNATRRPPGRPVTIPDDRWLPTRAVCGPEQPAVCVNPSSSSLFRSRVGGTSHHVLVQLGREPNGWNRQWLL